MDKNKEKVFKGNKFILEGVQNNHDKLWHLNINNKQKSTDTNYIDAIIQKRAQNNI